MSYKNSIDKAITQFLAPPFTMLAIRSIFLAALCATLASISNAITVCDSSSDIVLGTVEVHVTISRVRQNSVISMLMLTNIQALGRLHSPNGLFN